MRIYARWPALVLIGFQIRQKTMSWQKHHYNIIIITIGSAGTKKKNKKPIRQKLCGRARVCVCVCIIRYIIYYYYGYNIIVDRQWTSALEAQVQTGKRFQRRAIYIYIICVMYILVQ